MIDPTKILLQGLVPALKTATGLNVYTQLPEQALIQYPYIWVSDVYVDEIGTKDSFWYECDTLIQVVYKQSTSLISFLDAKNNVLSIVNNNVPFTLSGGHKILECRLNNTTQTTEINDVGLLNVAFIRVYFDVE